MFWYLIAILLVLLSVRLIYRGLTHPLAKYPGPFLARYTDLWHLVTYRRQNGHLVDEKLHAQYGPIVRTGPNSLSFSSLQAYNLIYTANKDLEKGSFYDFARDPTTGQGSLFTTRTFAELKDTRRRVLHGAFSSPNIAAYKPMIASEAVVLTRDLDDAVQTKEGSINISPLVQGYVTSLIFQLIHGLKLTDPTSITPKEATEGVPDMTKLSSDPSKLSKLSTNPSKMSKLSANPSKMSKLSANPSKMSKFSTNPSKMSKFSTNPSKMSKFSTNPSKMSKLSTNPSKMSEFSADPSKMSNLSANPSKMSKLSANPSKMSKLSDNPSKMSKFSTNPSKMSKFSTNPSKMSKLSTNPSKMSKLSGSPSKMSKLSASPSKISKLASNFSYTPLLAYAASSRPAQALLRWLKIDQAPVGAGDWGDVIARSNEALYSRDDEVKATDAPTSFFKSWLSVDPSDTVKYMNKEQIYRESINIILAGRGSTTAAVALIIHMLGRKEGQIWQQKVREELAAHKGNESMPPIFAAVAKETLRLHPPFPHGFPREVGRDTEVIMPGMDRPLPGGTAVYSSTYVLGRSTSIWGHDAAEWKPERWTSEANGTDHIDNGSLETGSLDSRFAVFGKGMRGCMGREIAMTAMLEAVKQVVARFEIHAEGELTAAADWEARYDDCQVTFQPIEEAA